MFRRPVRAVLDPLSRAAGSDIYVRSESELRAAVGEIARRGKAGRIVVAEDIVVTSTIVLTAACAGTVFSCASGASVKSGISDPLFEYRSSASRQDADISFVGFKAYGLSEYGSGLGAYGPFTFFFIKEASHTLRGFTFSACDVRCSPFFVAGTGYAGGVNVTYLNISDCVIDTRADGDGLHVIDAYCYDSVVSGCNIPSTTNGNESVRIGGPRNMFVNTVLGGGDITWSSSDGVISAVNDLNSITVSDSANRIVGCNVATVVINNNATDCSVTGNTISTSVTTTASIGGNTVTGNAGGATLTLHGSDVQAGNV